MIVGTSVSNFYPVEQLCSTVKKFIRVSLPVDQRYCNNGVWWIHKNSVLTVLKRAKATGNHTVLDYSKVEPEFKATIDNILLGRKLRITIPQSPANTPYAVLHLQDTAPKELVEAAYKVLAKQLHPDVQGGSHEAFLRLKEAYDTVISLHGKVT